MFLGHSRLKPSKSALSFLLLFKKNTKMLKGNFGFLGAGMMAEAVLRGMLSAQLTTVDNVWVSDVSTERRELMTELGVHVTPDNVQVVAHCDVILVAVKPDKVREVLTECKQHTSKSKLFVSIAAGVTLETLQSCLPATSRIIRVMPNTPCLVGASATAYALGYAATEEDGQTVATIFGSTGVAKEVPESMMDAVTGLSGSGPAYVFMFIEALADGGVRMGLPRDVARSLAAQTVFGSAKMVLENPKIHAAEFRNRVESPGGTTIAGSHALENGQFRGTVINAVVAATERCTQLGAMSKNQTK
eukprot:comp24036_c0_seq1/m.43036 comp24036_c0_seq1/g.43036  ORF comp24036_c0_seq1/g.43036 comp24036_c0_seq1/m.43036 type:complete len:303 (-) comp24036_c0_seq1:406-1314(-)